MRIIIANDNYYPNINGASYFAQRLAKGLIKAGHEVLVIAPSSCTHDEKFTLDSVNVFGVRSIPLERMRIARLWGVQEVIRRVVKEFQPDIIHIQSHFAISRKTAAIARELGIPVLGTNHFMPDNVIHYLPLPKSLVNRTKRIFWYFFLKTFNNLDTVTSPTHAAATCLLSIGLVKPVEVVSNGLDLEIFKASNDGRYLKSRYHLPDCPILLSVGRLDKEKKLDLVIRALELTISQIPIHLVIAGDGAERDNLKSLVSRLGLDSAVTFTGFVPDADLPNLYPLGDCFIMAGPFELQSLVTMEAMASGLPVVAVRALALPELVRDKENGFLYPDGDIEKLSAALKKIFSNQALRQKMSQKSQEYIKAHNIQKTIADFLALYNNLLKK